MLDQVAVLDMSLVGYFAMVAKILQNVQYETHPKILTSAFSHN